MYAIYANIYHQYTPNVSIYTMDPMGYIIIAISNHIKSTQVHYHIQYITLLLHLFAQLAIVYYKIHVF